MLRYETIILSVPEITADEASNLESQLDKFIGKADGKLISFEKWGKFKLAYPVRKNDYGVYFLMRFELEKSPKALLDEIESYFKIKLGNIIMRSMTSKLDLKASLDYKRSESLEDIPSGSKDMSSFLKENKMEGIEGLLKKDKKTEVVEEIKEDLKEKA